MQQRSFHSWCQGRGDSINCMFFFSFFFYGIHFYNNLIAHGCKMGSMWDVGHSTFSAQWLCFSNVTWACLCSTVLMNENKEAPAGSLTPSQERSLLLLKEQINSLVSNFSGLLQTAAIGYTESIADEEEAEGGVNEKPVDIASQTHSDLHAGVIKQDLQAAVAARNLTHAAETLINLIAGLKVSLVLHDSERKNRMLRSLSANFEEQQTHNETALRELRNELQGALRELEEVNGI